MWLAHTVYSGSRYSGDLVIPDTLTSQSHLAIADKLKFWSSRYNGNLIIRVRYSKVRLYILALPRLETHWKELQLIPVPVVYP